MTAPDGVIDLIAVEIATLGIRHVALTPAERKLAATRILNGGSLGQVSRRLHVSGTTARTLTGHTGRSQDRSTDERKADA